VHYTLQRARERVVEQRRVRDEDGAAVQRDRNAQAACARAAMWSNTTSQIGDERPLSCCAASRDGTVVVTGGWSGLAKVWRTTDCECAQTLVGHKERVLGVAVHPTTDSQADPR
jgi:U4/U6 small nuclear ribonucleoprotein PRP4